MQIPSYFCRRDALNDVYYDLEKRRSNFDLRRSYDQKSGVIKACQNAHQSMRIDELITMTPRMQLYRFSVRRFRQERTLM